MRRRAGHSSFIALVVSPLLLIGCGDSENANGTGGMAKLDGGGTGGANIDGGSIDAAAAVDSKVAPDASISIDLLPVVIDAGAADGGTAGTGCGAGTINNIDLTSSYTEAWAVGPQQGDAVHPGYKGPLVAAAPTNGNNGTGITFANWNGNYVCVTQGNTTTIRFTPIALNSDSVVNSLINNLSGGSNTQAVITFTNSNNSTAVYSLVGGRTIRDFNNYIWQNGLTGSNGNPGLGAVTAQEWWNNGDSGMYQRLDVQTFVLPSSWNGSDLDSITITDPSDSSGSVVLSALQVRSSACSGAGVVGTDGGAGNTGDGGGAVSH
jgi:hypothetical protein